MFSLLVVLFATNAYARDHISVVGSSTVYPFVTVAAERFGKADEFRTPIIESTGTGGGLKLFCGGIGENYPDFANASRAIKKSEVELCKKNDIEGISEFTIGYDAIVLANALKNPILFNLTRHEIFLALAKLVPAENGLIENPYQTWKDIDPALPDIGIEVYGPGATSGTRDAFVELVIEPTCIENEAFLKAYPEKEDRFAACKHLREDGRYVEAGENDNLIIQKLVHNENALGIFGFSFLQSNKDLVKGAFIEGIDPTVDSITSHTYPVSRPLFIYMKNEHIKLVKGMKAFMEEIMSDQALGLDGYMIDQGLIPPTPEDIQLNRATLNNL